MCMYSYVRMNVCMYEYPHHQQLTLRLIPYYSVTSMTQYLNPSVLSSIEFRKMLGREKPFSISLRPNVQPVCSFLLKWVYILLIRILLRGVITSHVYASISAYVKIYPYPVILIFLNWKILLLLNWNPILWSSTKAQVF